MSRRYLTVVNNALIPCVFFVDCLLLSGIIVLWYFIVFWEGAGFILNRPYIPCADIPHYSYPNVDNLVPDVVVFVLCFAVPPVVILLGEAALAFNQLQKNESPVLEKTVVTFDIKLHPIIRRTCRFVGIFALGGFVTWILTRAAVLILGYPAPYFFSVCALPSSLCTGTNVVFQLPECTGTADDLARQSFPSLFAALSAYAAVFTGVYVTNVFVVKSAKTLQPLVALCSASMSFLISLEQIAYYKSSWNDVIAGWLLGGLIALYLSVSVLNSFLGHRFSPGHIYPQLTGSSQPGTRYFERPIYLDRNAQVKGLSREISTENQYDIKFIASSKVTSLLHLLTSSPVTGPLRVAHQQSNIKQHGVFTYDGVRGRAGTTVTGGQRAIIRPLPRSNSSSNSAVGTNYF